MNIYEINFYFKGNRDYVHSTDIYNKINKFIIDELKFENISKIDMSIHEFVKNNLDLEIYKNEDVDRRQNTVAVFSFILNSDKYKLLLSENNKNIDCRHEYPEEEIVKKCKLNTEKKMIILDSITNFTDVEVFTVMNKKLLKTLYPKVDGKWLSVRMQMNKYEEKSEYNRISIELKHNFNFKLTKSLIKIDDKEKGFIYFSLM